MSTENRSQAKRAVLISCSDHYGHRLWAVDTYLKSRGYETVYLTSDFSHDRKEVFTCSVPGCRQLHVRPYQKNLSADRILSHREFAKKAVRWIEELEQEPQMVVSILPPNFLAKYLAAYKRRHPDVRLVFDIFDLWPETFPSSKMKRLLALPFSVWSGLRDHHLAEADRVLTECHMFQERLNLSDEQAHTVFLAAQRPEGLEDAQELDAERIELCYLGAINNIVNIPAIAALAGELSELRPVTVHIIGEGERREELVQAIRDAGAQAEFHGAIYDEAEKHRILTRCRFGLNLMRDSVCIGLTMKSVDYWKHDLPVINNIPADSARLVEAERIGLNLAPDTAKRIAAMPAEECLAMRKNVRRVFDRCFDLPAVLHEYDAALRDLI